MKAFYKLFLCILFVSIPFLGFAQKETLSSIRQQLDASRSWTLQEKIFVHTDRSFYMTGELMAFKLYYVDGTLHKPLDMSKVAYLDLLDKEKKSVLQAKIPLASGAGNGAVFLPASLNSGNYLVRVYTSWMQNFSADYFFEKVITVVNPFKQLGLQPLKDSVAYDVQFFPEGGNLVRDLPSKVAFRMTDASGKGVSMQGAILSQNNDTITRFQPLTFGIGTFSFTPAAGNQYKAVVKDARGKLITVPLPTINDQGYVMHLEESGSDQLKLTVYAQQPATSDVHLLAHTRQSVKVSESRSLANGSTTFLIPKKALGEGISQLTIFNGNGQPVGERLWFRRPDKPLQLDVKPDKQQYTTRSKVSLDITATATSELSVSVYRLDSLQLGESNSILSYLLLSSDLRGTIESPDYYVRSAGAEVTEATDNLMLTHGWRRFRWDDLLQKRTPAFTKIPEPNGHMVRGRIIDPSTNKPVQGILTYLSVPGKPVRLYGSRSDENGLVQFEVTDFWGAKEIVLLTNPKDSLYRIDLLNPFSDARTGTRLPQFSIARSLEKDVLERSIPMQVQNAYFRDQLARPLYPKVDSAAFFGKPDENYRLDDFTRFTVMEDVFREYVPGLQARLRRNGYRLQALNFPYKMFFEETPLVLIDGVPVFDIDKLMAFSPLKVQRLQVMTRRYFLGSLLFNGIASFTTYKGDMAGFPLSSQTLLLDYDGLQGQREFYAPKYDTPERMASRLPDLRNLLYWNPTVRTNEQGQVNLDFYTSDQTGNYLVVINGLSREGQPGFSTVPFSVQNPVK
ncbi:hypothetical protein [Tellurirhabdus bombi]|uniref:hypothetical protein n=1 Tax=Tellurirhabdus bombi TaxID=2907205 RepID=UPI001F1BBD2D|nr:hypothetical protein [Tellurirhabdus bombi]